MATQVLIAHTGQRLETDTSRFTNLDDLKAWVARNASIAPQHFIALTPQGRTVKFAGLYAEKEIYVYDSRTTQPPPADGTPPVVSHISLPKPYSRPSAPNVKRKLETIASCQELHKQHRAWALRVLEDCTGMSTIAQRRYAEIDGMIKCMDAAVANIEISVKQLEPKYTELKKWVDPALKENARLVSTWQEYMALAKNTPVDASIVKFMTRSKGSVKNATLEDLIEVDTARKAGNLAPTAHRRFSEKAEVLDRFASDMYQELENLIAEFDRLTNRSLMGRCDESIQLLQEIEDIAQHFDTDCRTALAYDGSPKDVAMASQTASHHTSHLIPLLEERSNMMDEILQYSSRSRNTIATEAFHFMQAITNITSLRSSVKDQMNVLSQSEDDMTTFDYLRLLQQLPYMYASFVAESIRRSAWNEKIKADSSTIANEMALFQEEENKRRRRWQKMIGGTYGADMAINVMGLEVSILGDDGSWPVATKEDLNQFYESIAGQNIDESVLEDISQLIKELDSPTKQQNKRLKAFKNGSVHEASLGRSGLLIRGDDELLRSLYEDKNRLENKVRNADSRVRRLEDLLHRQSQASHTGNLFQPQSPLSHGRKNSTSSIKSGRIENQRQSEDTDASQRRIAQLEKELQDEKQRTSSLEKDLAGRNDNHDDMRSQIQEANSTKKDLLDNLEALKREFNEERKSLVGEMEGLRARLEETEYEIEHFDECRSAEKSSFEEKIQELEAELERVNKEHKDESLKSQGQVDFLRNETGMQRQQCEDLERQAQAARDEGRLTLKKLSELQELSDARFEALQKIYSELALNGPIPDDLVDLVDNITTKTSDLLAKVRNMVSDATFMRRDLDEALNSGKELKAELSRTHDKLSAEESSTIRVRDHLQEEKAKVVSLERELEENRVQLSDLRARLSDGECGSDTLQKKLEEEEKKTVNLSEEVASRQSQMGSLEEELQMTREQLASLRTKVSGLTDHNESRAERSKDLTQRLYSQNDRMCYLLERMGYSVSRNDGRMAVTKVPRAERTAQNPNDSSDAGASLRKSSTLLGAKALHDSIDLDLLQWTNNTSAAAEAEKYNAFMSKLGDFDMDLFSDTVYHRLKDVELKARKWQREARSYRDKAHEMQKDSHQKIAFKHFKEGDLALFLPTRNQQAGAWAAFNVGFPHYFLREQDAHRLRHREWLVARISRIQERVVDLSKSLQTTAESDSTNDEENDNPFQLSDGLRWYLIDAHEDKPGAPSTPGMGKSTVAANTVAATASIHTHAAAGKNKSNDGTAGIVGINKSLSRSLESRRSSTSSKKALPFVGSIAHAQLKSSALASETNSLRAAASETPAGTSPVQGSHISTGEASKALAAAGAGSGVGRYRSSSKDTKSSRKADDEFQRGESPRAASTTKILPEFEGGLRDGWEELGKDSSGRRSVIWNELWHVDYSYESPARYRNIDS